MNYALYVVTLHFTLKVIAWIISMLYYVTDTENNSFINTSLNSTL